MRKLLFLSSPAADSAICDDVLAEQPLAELGFEVVTQNWQSVDSCGEYAAAIVRSTWDYCDHLEHFLGVLAGIEAPLHNPLATIRWNAHKGYLREFADFCLPTHYHRSSELTDDLKSRLLNLYGAVVIKPTIGLGGRNTYLVDSLGGWPEHLPDDSEWMVQPLADSIFREGELSLVYFNKQFSHAVRKVPGESEFRIHEQYGGKHQLVAPDRQALEMAGSVLQRIADPLLYSRVDLVKYDSRWALMEVEAIEPSLYLKMDEAAPERFAQAIERISRAGAP